MRPRGRSHRRKKPLPRRQVWWGRFTGYQAGLTSGLGLAGAGLAAVAVGAGIGFGVRRGQAKTTDIVKTAAGDFVQRVVWGVSHRVSDPDASPEPDQDLWEDLSETPTIRRARVSPIIPAPTPDATVAPKVGNGLGPAIKNEDWEPTGP